MNRGHNYKTEAHSYYQYKDIDREFYQQYLKDFLPEEIFDTHVHLGLPEHFYPVSSERKFEDWALGVGYNLSVEAAFFAYAELFPGKEVSILGFPFPIKEAKLDEINRYVCSYINKGRIKGLMATHPDWAYQKVKEELQKNNFLGIKPYPDLVSKVKGADLSIFKFLPHSHLRAVDELGKIVLLHLPRRERLRDKDNIREIKEIRQKYPRIKLILPHIGRSFCPSFAREGLRYLRDDPGIFFDTAAVLNPEVYKITLNEVGPKRLLYGSDLPILFLKGKREWEGDRYINYSSGNYLWNTKRKPSEEEARYTFFLYEEIKALRCSIESLNMGTEAVEAIFYKNAKEIFEK